LNTWDLAASFEQSRKDLAAFLLPLPPQAVRGYLSSPEVIGAIIFTKSQEFLGEHMNNQKSGLRRLPRNVWVVTMTSFLTDISSEMIFNLVPDERRGTAYGLYNATIGLMALPASVIAGLLWQGAFGWDGFGPAAPFLFGAGLALLAGVLFWILVPAKQTSRAS
jgi:MFS family permease